MGDAMIVVGAGQAGGRAALGLRAACHAGPVVLLGAERAAPCERPPLSKDFLKRLRTADSLTFASADALVAAGVDFRPGITATATAASHPLGGGRQRLESWHNAEVQGALAARNMLGAGERATGLPWFWSDQYELTLQMAGYPDRASRTIERDQGDALLLFHLAGDGRIVGVSGLGQSGFAKAFKIAQLLPERDLAPDPAVLGDPASRLRTLLR